MKPFDYWHEKVALTKLAHDLKADGWDVGLSVDPRKLDSDEALGSAEIRVLDDAFRAAFNADPIPGETPFRYRFYRDQPGYIDLVARRDGTTLIVEGKGRSATNRRGAVAQIVGALLLERRPERDDVRYGILLPGGSGNDDDVAEGARWDRALRNYGQLDWIAIYRISRDGVIVLDTWGAYEHHVDQLRTS